MVDASLAPVGVSVPLELVSEEMEAGITFETTEETVERSTINGLARAWKNKYQVLTFCRELFELGLISRLMLIVAIMEKSAVV